MGSLWLLAIGLIVFAFGWFIYSHFVAKHVLCLDEEFVTPAVEFEDGVDFVPTNKFVLWGHHFTAVAGAAPIVGPAIAVAWGWLPAFLWVVLGTVFFAGIHDMSALWASVRNQGKSIGSVCTKFVGSKVGQVFMVVIFLVLLMVNSAFGVIIAKESVDHPTTVIPAWGAILIALLMGQAIYKMKLPLLWVTVVAVIALYALVPLGVMFPVSFSEQMAASGMDIRAWVIILFVYAGIASVLPVWMLLQPRDYVNGIQLFIGLALLYVSVFIVNPTVVAPEIIPAIKDDGNWQMIVPVLFITIACGAISGFHGIVSSGTTSKQVQNYKDVRFVGYLGAMGEGSLSLATIICCVAGFGLIAGNSGLSIESWGILGDANSYKALIAGKGSAPGFVEGGGAIIEQGIGLPTSVSSTLLSLMLVLFAATTMDAGIRLQRYIIQEWGEMYKIPAISGKGVSTLIAVLLSFALAWSGIGDKGQNEVAIWPLFGATNQLLASLTLMVIAVMLMKNRKIKGSLVVLVPMCFILIMSFWGALIQLGNYYTSEKWLLFVLNIVVLIVTILVVLSALSQIFKVLKNKDA